MPVAVRLGAVAAGLVIIGATAGVVWWAVPPSGPVGPPVTVAAATLTREGRSAPPADVRRAVRRLEATGCGAVRQATASAVRAHGRRWVLTNRHVVAGSPMVRLFAAGREAPGTARVDGWVPGRDVAVLAGGPGPSLPAGPRPEPGDRVLVVGYPGGAFRARAGTVRTVEVRSGFGGTSDVLLVDVTAAPGLSGGLVVDGAGRAVGLVAARDPATGWTVAYPVDALGTLSAGPHPGVPSC